MMNRLAQTICTRIGGEFARQIETQVQPTMVMVGSGFAALQFPMTDRQKIDMRKNGGKC